MNQNTYLLLLVFFFFIHVEKTYGDCQPGDCKPVGDYCDPKDSRPCGAKVTDANLLADSTLSITVSSPSPPTGFGHFTIQTDFDQQFYRLLKNSRLTNGGDCSVTDGKDNPFTSLWKYDFPTPPLGTWFDIWVSVYWHCNGDPNPSGCGVRCTSEDIHYRGYVH